MDEFKSSVKFALSAYIILYEQPRCIRYTNLVLSLLKARCWQLDINACTYIFIHDGLECLT